MFMYNIQWDQAQSQEGMIILVGSEIFERMSQPEGPEVPEDMPWKGTVVFPSPSLYFLARC